MRVLVGRIFFRGDDDDAGASDICVLPRPVCGVSSPFRSVVCARACLVCRVRARVGGSVFNQVAATKKRTLTQCGACAVAPVPLLSNY